MASARFAWGIDIGNRALKAVKLVRDGDQLRVDDFDLIEHEHVLSNAGDNREALIQTALTNFVQKHPQKGGVVSAGVSGQASFARFIKLPPVERKKIPEIVRFEAIQQIPFPLDDVEWAYQLFESPESPDVEVGIFAMRKDLIARHIKYFTDVDMNVQVVQMSPLAVYNAVYYDQRLKGTTMVIDLGAENTDLIICDNDSVWMRSIPIGGNNFTETLVKAFKLPFAKAEDLKRNAATSKYARQIFQAMRPVFADLVAEIQRSVGFYASVHRDSRIKKIIALGGTFRLPGLQKYLQQNLSLDVERLDNLAAGAPADPKLAATFNENLLSVIGAYGLAVQAMGEGKITSSLLPTAIRREKMWKEKIPYFGAAAAMFVAGSGIALGGYFLEYAKYRTAEPDREQIAQIQRTGNDLDKQWSDIESSGANERAVIANVMTLQQNRDFWPNLLRDIQMAVPKPPQPEVVEGLRKADGSLIKKVARADRELIVIDSIAAFYHPNIGAVLKGPDADLKKYLKEGADPAVPVVVAVDGAPPPEASEDGTTPPPPPVVASTGGKEARGFFITIKGTTPFGNAGKLIDSVFPDALKKISPNATTPKMRYAVVKTYTASLATIGNSKPIQDKLIARHRELIKYQLLAATPRGEGAEAETPTPVPSLPGRQMPGGIPVAPQAAAPIVSRASDEEAFKDRLTGEDIRNDTAFTIIIAVQIDPDPFTPPAAPPTANAGQ